MYGGFATTASYCRASSRACCKSGLRTWAGACVRSPNFNTSSSRFSISGSFDASVGGTWISEPNVLPFSNNSNKQEISAWMTWPFSASAFLLNSPSFSS